MHACREAIVLVAIPMFASAASTVITTTPLFATQTLILNRFASVIFVTMLIGLAFVVLFMTPMLAMFGPGYKAPAEDSLLQKDQPLAKIIQVSLLRSFAVRFLMITVVTILIFVRFPSPHLVHFCYMSGSCSVCS